MRLKLFLLTILSFFLFQIVNSQTKDREEMVKKVFATLHDKDEEAYVKLFPKGELVRDFMKKMLATDSAVEDGSAISSIMEEFTDSALLVTFHSLYNKAIDLGEKRGVDWRSANFIFYTGDSTFSAEDGGSKLSGKIYFTSNGKDYFLTYDDVIWFENEGWYGVEIRSVNNKENEVAVEDTEFGAGEKIDVVADTTAKLPPKTRVKAKPKTTKTVVPAKNIKTVKSKTTPARKPE